MTVLVWVSCAIPIAIGFAIPAINLFSKSVLNRNTWKIQKIWVIGERVVSLTLMESFAACLLTLLIGLRVRLQRGASAKWLAQFGSVSHAFPGTILALGVLRSLSSVDNVIDHCMRELFGISICSLFTGTAFVLVSACVTRFLAIAYVSVISSFQAIPRALTGFHSFSAKNFALH